MLLWKKLRNKAIDNAYRNESSCAGMSSLGSGSSKPVANGTAPPQPPATKPSVTGPNAGKPPTTGILHTLLRFRGSRRFIWRHVQVRARSVLS